MRESISNMEKKWILFEDKLPMPNEPCEYIICVRCKGWYRGDEENLTRFAADERKIPSSELHAWRHWEEGEPWEQGKALVREYRKHLKEKGDVSN